MKTLEQKAKAYDEAIERANELNYVSDKDSLQRKTVEHIFPELKESEDERIRKKLIDCFKENNAALAFEGISNESVLAWLEKQKTSDEALQYLKENHSPSEVSDFQAAMNIAVAKAYDKGYNDGLKKQDEQKPVDKVEPKFKVEKDKWYVCISQYCNCIEGRNYKASLDGRIIDDYGTEYDMHNDAYRWFRPWTIQDAKDGDVLAIDPWSDYPSSFVAIYKKQNEEDFDNFDSYCFVGFDGKFYENEDGHSSEDIHLATKEQRDFLFQKIHEAGYEWDAEKKELKKIEQILADLPNGEDYGIDGLYAAVDILQKTLGNVGGYQTDDGILEHECAISAVKQLYEKKPAAWSEEDATHYNRILKELNLQKEMPINASVIEEIKSDIIWLKSLKDRVQLQPQWKPSDEQMKTLEESIMFLETSCVSISQFALKALYRDLKKLKE